MTAKRSLRMMKLLGLIITVFAASALAQQTSFTYQGRLQTGGAPANGTFDFQFAVHDNPVGGTALGAAMIHDDVTVSNGLFMVTLDFGSEVWTGGNRWLEISVREGSSAGSFTNLIPRQAVTSSPLAIQALNYKGPVNTAQLVGQVAATNIADGSILSSMLASGAVTAEKLSSDFSNSLMSASTAALAVVSNRLLGMFETTLVPELVTTPNTNTIWVSAAGSVGFTAPQQFWRSTDGSFTNPLTIATGRRVTNNGSYWLVERTSAPNLYTNATLTGAYTTASGIPPAPVISWGTNIVGTNYVPQLRDNVGAEAYAAIAFKGGQSGWPPYGADERGFMLFSTDGKNWIGGTGRPILDEPMRNGGLIRVGPAFAFGYSPHTSTQLVSHVALRITTNFADWDFRTNLSAAMPGEVLPPNTRTWVAAQPLVIVGSNLWFFFSISTNGSLTNHSMVGTFKQRAISCPLQTFPHGWSAAYEWEFPRTNVIDFNPYFDEASQKLVGIYKDETRTVNEFAVFSHLDLPNASVSMANEYPFGPFPVGEAAITVKVPGGFRSYRTMFHYDYGSFGRGHVVICQDTTNLFTGWPDHYKWQVLNVSADFQAFGVLRLTNHVDIQNAMAAAISGTGLSGMVNIRGALGEQYGGWVDRGFAYTNSPSQPNDHAGINIGTDSWTAGGWGVQRNNNQYQMDWWLADDSISSSALPYVSSYARMLAFAQTNRFNFLVPIYGSGVGLMNISPVGVSGTAATLSGTNRFIGANVFSTGLSLSDVPSSRISSNHLGPLVLGNNRFWIDDLGNLQKASGTQFKLGGASNSPSIVDIANTALLSGNLRVTGQVSAVNGVVLPNTAPIGSVPLLTETGAQLLSDGTNLLVILQNAGGVRTTNRVSLSPWP